MKLKPQNDLLAIDIATLLFVLIVTLVHSTALRIVLGLPFILFFPGYALVGVLFPRQRSLGGIERAAIGFGLSIAVVPLIGLILNYTPWGIRLYPLLIAVAAFICATSAVAWWRRWRLPPEERFHLSFKVARPAWRSRSFPDKALSIVLIAAVLSTVGMLAYMVAVPKVSERFTEFYVLGLEGKMENYPAKLSVGEKGKVTLIIVNHEHAKVSYRIEASIDGERTKILLGETELDQIETGALVSEEPWEQEIGFVPQKTGNAQKVEFLLYQEGTAEAYRALHLWIDVS